jgi:hypothetical protein
MRYGGALGDIKGAITRLRIRWGAIIEVPD